MTRPETVGEDFREIAHAAVTAAQGAGAQEVAARVAKVREVGVQWRDGQIEQVTESTTRGLALSLYVDGRFASVSTSDLRPEAIGPFIGDAVAMTRTLSEDPFRVLPDPALYANRPDLDLQFADPDHRGSGPHRSRRGQDSFRDHLGERLALGDVPGHLERLRGRTDRHFILAFGQRDREGQRWTPAGGR
jgi:hypothetical protein